MTRAAAAIGALILMGACASSPKTTAGDTTPASDAQATDGDRIERLEKRVNSMERTIELLTVLNQSLVEEVASLTAAVASAGAQAAPARRGPDPSVVYSIPVQNNAFWGPADAKVTIVEAMEFACPACEGARAFVESLEKEFQSESVRIVYKSFVVHPTRATLPARAACAAHLQGKFFDIYPLLWDAFIARKFDGASDDEQDVLDAAKQITGIDMKQLAVDMAGPCVDIVANDQAELRKAKTGGTPTFYINGRVLTERTVDAVKQLVTEELALADQRIAQGAAQAHYYDEWIVNKGQ